MKRQQNTEWQSDSGKPMLTRDNSKDCLSWDRYHIEQTFLTLQNLKELKDCIDDALLESECSGEALPESPSEKSFAARLMDKLAHVGNNPSEKVLGGPLD